MNKLLGAIAAGLLAASLLAVPSAVRAEVVEEIVAWVNGQIITSSELERQEQALMAEIYRRFTGEELDEQMRILRKELLMEMIDNKILMSEASTMFDMEKLAEVLYENFRENFPDDEQLQQAMAQEGMTDEDLRQWLLEENAPQEVLINEVGARVSVSDKELREYYDEHKDQFVMPAEVTIREIVLLADSEAAREKRRAEAEEVRARAVAAEDFAAVARDVSEAGTAAEGGELGPLKHGELSEQLEALAFSLPVGEISELLEMPYGFHIIKIAPMEEIGEQLRAWLTDRKMVEARQEYMVKARDEAEWCVKAKYADQLPDHVDYEPCEQY
jgi:parvulin-like peptidyl-prolyl isomerase